MKTPLLKILLPFIILFLVTACQKNESDPMDENPAKDHAIEFDHSVIWEWNELYLRIDKDVLGYRPNHAPQSLAYLGLAAYELAVPGMPAFKNLRD